LLLLALASNYWYIIEEKTSRNAPTNTTARPFQYQCSIGLWMTCYDKNVPDTGKKYFNLFA